MTILELIKDLKLEQNRVVDLTQISSEMHYYSSFDLALADVNNNVYGGDTTEENAVMALFGTNDVFVMRMLSDIDLSDKELIQFDNNIIFDLNGHTLSLGNTNMRLSEDSGQVTDNGQPLAKNNYSFLFYGMEKGSAISVNRDKDIKSVFESFVGTVFTGIIGGNYSYLMNNTTEMPSFSTVCYALHGATTIICNCNLDGKEIRTISYEGDISYSRILIRTVGDTYIKNTNAVLDLQEADEHCKISGRCIYGIGSTDLQNDTVTLENCNVTIYDINDSRSHRALNIGAPITKIVNCNIQQISTKGTWYATSNEWSQGCALSGNRNKLVYIENSYISGGHCGISIHYGQVYALNCRFAGASHGGAYCSGTSNAEDVCYFKNCEFECVEDPTATSTIEAGYSLGSIFIGYGATVYADGCTFDTWRDATICFNQRVASPRSSTIHISNCICKKNIRGGTTVDGDSEVQYSTLVIGKNNIIPNESSLIQASSMNSTKLYVEQQPDGYYGDKPDFVNDFLSSTAEYLNKLELNRIDLSNVCSTLGISDNKNSKLSALVNSLDIFSMTPSEEGTKVQYIEETINGVLDELIYTVDFEPYSVLFVCNDKISAIESLMANTSVTSKNLLAANMLIYIKSNFAENQTFSLISSLYWVKDATGVVDINTRSSTIINLEQDETTKKWNVKIGKADTSTNAYRIMSDGTYPLQIMIIGR